MNNILKEYNSWLCHASECKQYASQLTCLCTERNEDGQYMLDVPKDRTYILMFRGNPVSAVATIQKDRASAKHINNGVPVVVWDISEADEKALDQYEGFPRLYKKDSIDVEMSDGSKLKAMVYIMTEGYGIGIPSGHYFNTILEGYLDNGIDTEYLFKRLEMMSKLMK